jgi:peptidoglycan-associated lipoprotein
MMRHRQGFMHWIVVAGLAGLIVLGGCSRKNVEATTSGMEAPQAGTGQREPLTGFAKTPTEEAVKSPSTPMEVAKATPQAGGPAKTQRELLDVYFEFDKWGLTTEGKKHLNQNADVLKQNPTAKVLIEGNCDERGTHEYNLVLGEKRARETRQYLESLGIKNHVAVKSYGKERPVCTEQDEACYWKNRRAHVVVQTSK